MSDNTCKKDTDSNCTNCCIYKTEKLYETFTNFQNFQVHSINTINSYLPGYTDYLIEYVAKMKDTQYIVVLLKKGIFDREIRKVVLDSQNKYQWEIREGPVQENKQAQTKTPNITPLPFGGGAKSKSKSTRSKKPKQKKSRSRK
jgi:hypothetical protein